MITMEAECPIGAVEKALELASRLEIREIPQDFDPGDARWKQILSTIALQFSNHPALLEQLMEWLDQARSELAEDCHFVAAHGDRVPVEECATCWLAKYRLWEAALNASEKAYQRWLAKQALRRAKEQVG